MTAISARCATQRERPSGWRFTHNWVGFCLLPGQTCSKQRSKCRTRSGHDVKHLGRSAAQSTCPFGWRLTHNWVGFWAAILKALGAECFNLPRHRPPLPEDVTTSARRASPEQQVRTRISPQHVLDAWRSDLVTLQAGHFLDRRPRARAELPQRQPTYRSLEAQAVGRTAKQDQV